MNKMSIEFNQKEITNHIYFICIIVYIRGVVR